MIVQIDCDGCYVGDGDASSALSHLKVRVGEVASISAALVHSGSISPEHCLELAAQCRPNLRPRHSHERDLAAEPAHIVGTTFAVLAIQPFIPCPVQDCSQPAHFLARTPGRALTTNPVTTFAYSAVARDSWPR